MMRARLTLPLTWRRALYLVVFESETRAGRLFDLALIATIMLSVLTVMLESVAEIQAQWGRWLYALDWFFTVLFTIEYGLRLACAPSPRRYATSFFGVIDLISILPLYLAWLIPGSHLLVDVRILRLLRIFRILKLVRYLGEARELLRALRAARRKITVFLATVLTLVVVLGTLMYVVEGPEHGYTSIPTGIYWAVVTLTTVGYGDISPQTPVGRAIASLVMILGYSIIAVPTGIMSAEFARGMNSGAVPSRRCSNCGPMPHDQDARFCKHCGSSLTQ